MMTNMFDHFLEAQDSVVDNVIAELQAGKKKTHWMWFIFPQIKGLGLSDMSKKYALSDSEQARQYLNGPVLKARLRMFTKLVLDTEDSSLDEIFGYPDNMKFISCMTLFSSVDTDDDKIFIQALNKYNKGHGCYQTVKIIASEIPVKIGKTPVHSDVETTHIVQPPDTNAHGTAFGGQIMRWMDIAAGVSATRHCRLPCVTVSVDRLHFAKPINLGDIVIIKARVNHAGTTSMEVGVRVCKENPITGERVHCLTGYFTFVAIDKECKPTEVLGVLPVTEDDERRWKAAIDRRRTRLGK